jgi:WD40 repeat protein
MTPLMGVSFSPDGHRATLGCASTLVLLNLEGNHSASTMAGHEDWINGTAFLADGSQCISAALDKTIRVWDLETGKELRKIPQHFSSLHRMALTPDGRYLLATGGGMRAANSPQDAGPAHALGLLFDTEKGITLHSYGLFQNPVAPHLSRSADGHVFLMSDGESAWVLDPADQKQVRNVNALSRNVNFLIVTGDGRHAISANHDGTLGVWDLDPVQKVRTIPKSAGLDGPLAASADGKSFLCTADQGTLVQVEVVSGKELRRFQGHAGHVTSLAISPDGKRALSTGDDATVRFWDLTSAGSPVKVAGPVPVAPAPAPTPATPAADPEFRNQIYRWDLQSPPYPGSFTKDGRRALVAAGSNLKMFDVETKQATGNLKTDDPFLKAVALLPDGKRALTIGEDKVLRLWSLETAKKIREFKGHTSRISGLAVSPDGKTALTSSGGIVQGPDGKPVMRDNQFVFEDTVVRVWDVETGKELRKFEGHTSEVRGVRFTGDGSRALSFSNDSTIWWDVKTAEEVHRFNFRTWHAPALTADGTQALFVAANNKLLLWDLEKDTEVRTFDDPPEFPLGVSLSLDGRLGAVFSSRGKIVVYDVATGRKIYLLEGIGNFGVYGVMFTPDSHRAITLSSDNMARLYDLTPKKTPPK